MSSFYSERNSNFGGTSSNDLAAIIEEQNLYPKIDVPFHNTRRHYRSVAQLKDAGIARYDPVPKDKSAGLPNRAMNYNPINGQGKNITEVGYHSPQPKLLPVFLRNQIEVPYQQ